MPLSFILPGAYSVLSPMASVDLVGASVFATAYGQALFSMGIAAIFGCPFAGENQCRDSPKVQAYDECVTVRVWLGTTKYLKTKIENNIMR